MRDDFPQDVKRQLAMRVGHHCSNPDCSASTAGPQDTPSSSLNIGVAAHITAAASGGPRYATNLTTEQRREISNGIWLCQNCAHKIDRDLTHHTEEVLRAWKTIAEHKAARSIGSTSPIGREQLPDLKLYLENQGICDGTYGDPVRRLVFGLQNGGAGLARFPEVSFQRVSGWTVDLYGIDGNGRFGLPEAPSEPAKIAFRGGVDNVIHPGDTLKIGRLFQTGENRGIDGINPTPRAGLFGPGGLLIDHWRFPSIEIAYEIRADGTAPISESVSIPSDETDWRKRS